MIWVCGEFKCTYYQVFLQILCRLFSCVFTNKSEIGHNSEHCLEIVTTDQLLAQFLEWVLPRTRSFLSGKAQVWFGIFCNRQYGWSYSVLKGARINRMDMNTAMALAFRARKQAISHLSPLDKDIPNIVKKIQLTLILAAWKGYIWPGHKSDTISLILELGRVLAMNCTQNCN